MNKIIILVLSVSYEVADVRFYETTMRKSGLRQILNAAVKGKISEEKKIVHNNFVYQLKNYIASHDFPSINNIFCLPN